MNGSSMQERTDAIVERIQTTFESLPLKAKPRTYPDGSREWTPLSGIVLSTEKDGCLHSECVALGTGMRCLPADKITFAKGTCLHDWHAETVAIRALNLFLMHECSRLTADAAATSLYIRRRAEEEKSAELFQPFEISHGVRINMYSSEAPCGDASMELTMKAQDDATPWIVERKNDQTPPSTLSGRGHFSALGVVRRKPARADAPPTLSKSCSDKLALKQCTSILSCLTYLMITPSNAYLHQLILPQDQCVRGAVERAFSPTGRMSPLKLTKTTKSWAGGFSFKPFSVNTTAKPFGYSRLALPHKGKLSGSNITAMWTPMNREVLIGGTVQGYKQFAPRGASAISRASMWKLALSLAINLHEKALLESLQAPSYEQVKTSSLTSLRRAVKADVTSLALSNWNQNEVDNFDL